MSALVRQVLKPSENIYKVPAKRLFGAQTHSAAMPAQAIGTYALGCLAGAQALSQTGPTWQVMRPSRNRNWATPQLISFIQQISARAKERAAWPGLLVGDMSQPRGGPMPQGHASHQTGLDADVWFTPMPSYELSAKERETMVPLEMVKSHFDINAETWSLSRAKLLQTVAQDKRVERIFVHPPIKRELCRWATGDRSWLAKVRPLYGHTFHFHVRLACPAGMGNCKPQAEPNPEDGTGCGKELDYWYSPDRWRVHAPNPSDPKPRPKPPLTLSGLPAECAAVIKAP